MKKESDISNTLLRFVQIEAEKLLETEKKQKDDFAVGFAEYCFKFDNLKNESTYLIEQLLEIYKKKYDSIKAYHLTLIFKL